MKNTAIVAAIAGLALPASAHIIARQDAVDPDLAACQPQGDSSAACHVVEGIETECNAKDGVQHQSCMCSEKPFFDQWTKCRECVFRNRPSLLSGWMGNLEIAEASLCNSVNPTQKFQEIFANLPEPTAVDAQTTAGSSASSGPTATTSAVLGSSSAVLGSSDSSNEVDSEIVTRPDGDDIRQGAASTTGAPDGDDIRQGAANTTGAPVAQVTSGATLATTTAATTAATTASTTATRNATSSLTMGTSLPAGNLGSGASFNTAAGSILAFAVAGAAFMVL
ncbi:hypothetical protein CDD81_7117 [Ophiocordyceps australis]|uniref:Extracellular membrane protein CFEM domain-containing protein n=1 Tax=Ophiocordyceps australis TaxID=1399860 RepID=A0A2C5Y4W2_9HYPO|nr:hypothetical protein CDD81_7117 [Ophiocordyceps australis]